MRCSEQLFLFFYLFIFFLLSRKYKSSNDLFKTKQWMGFCVIILLLQWFWFITPYHILFQMDQISMKSAWFKHLKFFHWDLNIFTRCQSLVRIECKAVLLSVPLEASGNKIHDLNIFTGCRSFIFTEGQNGWSGLQMA